MKMNMYFSIRVKGLIEHNLPYDGSKSMIWTKTGKNIKEIPDLALGLPCLVSFHGEIKDEQVAREQHQISLL
jgi:hypothetical protein